MFCLLLLLLLLWIFILKSIYFETFDKKDSQIPLPLAKVGTKTNDLEVITPVTVTHSFSAIYRLPMSPPIVVVCCFPKICLWKVWGKLSTGNHLRHFWCKDIGLRITGWWFQPIPKILVKMGIFPKIGVKIKNI